MIKPVKLIIGENYDFQKRLKIEATILRTQAVAILDTLVEIYWLKKPLNISTKGLKANFKSNKL